MKINEVKSTKSKININRQKETETKSKRTEKEESKDDNKIEESVGKALEDT